jgi:hypothetical protein
LYPKSWERMTGNIEKQEILCMLAAEVALARNSCRLQSAKGSGETRAAAVCHCLCQSVS